MPDQRRRHGGPPPERRPRGPARDDLERDRERMQRFDQDRYATTHGYLWDEDDRSFRLGGRDDEGRLDVPRAGEGRAMMDRLRQETRGAREDEERRRRYLERLDDRERHAGGRRSREPERDERERERHRLRDDAARRFARPDERRYFERDADRRERARHGDDRRRLDDDERRHRARRYDAHRHDERRVDTAWDRSPDDVEDDLARGGWPERHDVGRDDERGDDRGWYAGRERDVHRPHVRDDDPDDPRDRERFDRWRERDDLRSEAARDDDDDEVERWRAFERDDLRWTDRDRPDVNRGGGQEYRPYGDDLIRGGRRR